MSQELSKQLGTVDSTPLQVNKFARRSRHSKIFSKRDLVKMRTSVFFTAILAPVNAIAKLTVVQKIAGAAILTVNTLKSRSSITPQKKLRYRALLMSGTILLTSSMSTASNFYQVGYSSAYADNYVQDYYVPSDILVADDDGFMHKINPQTNESNRIGMTDMAVHTVLGGETLSEIATKYDVSVDTIRWQNGMSAGSTVIRAGQKLSVPPVDGISYKVGSSDSLEKIAEKYEIKEESIIAQNSIGDDGISEGQSIFLPGAEPIQTAPVVVASGSYRNAAEVRANTTVNRSVDYTQYENSAAVAVAGKMIFPTKGVITQRYHGGHRAFDIADPSKPPIWAAQGGTVIKAAYGGWNGGYGNHVIISHGNGVETLYAHMDSLNVNVGDTVTQGQVIGIMGNTGRVYGRTGIHLHWEVRVGGQRLNPANYY